MGGSVGFSNCMDVLALVVVTAACCIASRVLFRSWVRAGMVEALVMADVVPVAVTGAVLVVVQELSCL